MHNMVFIEKGERFNLMFDPSADPLLVIEGVPNYFLFNKETDRIEYWSVSLKTARKVFEYAEGNNEAAQEAVLSMTEGFMH